jgi:hypothetical protein
MERIKIHRQMRDGPKGLIDAVHVGLERGDYGVSRSDAWGLDDYLAQVIINGLIILREDSHGWPACEEYPEPEDWDAALIDIIMRLKQASTRSEQHEKIYDEILWKPEDAAPAGLEDFEDWINRPPTPEWKEYCSRCRDVDDLANENIKYVMGWLSKWWFALWD